MLFCLVAGLLLAADPWTAQDVVEPAALAKDLKRAGRTLGGSNEFDDNARLLRAARSRAVSGEGPFIIDVGQDVLYRAVHIAGTPYAGPASKPEGIAELKKALAGQPHDRDIVLYCGCCPMDKCPNVRPAFTALHELGFTHVRVLSLPVNLKTDWTDKGYPVDRRSE